MALAERKTKKKWMLNPRGKKFESDYGQRIMQKMGWSEGKGLGVQGQGIKEPVRASGKYDSSGLGLKVKEEPWLKQQIEYESILAGFQDGKLGKVEKKTKSLEETSKNSRSRIHYARYVKSKDTTKYTAADWDCIFGRKKNSLGEEENDAEKEEENTVGQSIDLKNFGVTTIDRGNMNAYFAEKIKRLKAGRESAAITSERTFNVGDEKEISVSGGGKFFESVKLEEIDDSVAKDSNSSDTCEQTPKKKKKVVFAEFEDECVTQECKEDSAVKSAGAKKKSKKKKSRRKELENTCLSDNEFPVSEVETHDKENICDSQTDLPKERIEGVLLVPDDNDNLQCKNKYRKKRNCQPEEEISYPDSEIFEAEEKGKCVEISKSGKKSKTKITFKVDEEGSVLDETCFPGVSLDEIVDESIEESSEHRKKSKKHKVRKILNGREEGMLLEETSNTSSTLEKVLDESKEETLEHRKKSKKRIAHKHDLRSNAIEVNTSQGEGKGKCAEECEQFTDICETREKKQKKRKAKEEFLESICNAAEEEVPEDEKKNKGETTTEDSKAKTSRKKKKSLFKGSNFEFIAGYGH